MLDEVSALRLRADFHCSPLWLPDGLAMGDVGPDVDPDDLPLSPALKCALSAWAAEYDSTLNQEHPPDSGFASPADERAFAKEGARLWRELKRELPAVAVSYLDVVSGTLHE